MSLKSESEKNRYIVALDQGTSSSRAIVYDLQAKVIAKAQQEFEQIYPQSAWVEHDAKQILASQLSVLNKAIEEAGIRAEQVASIGITNQRETSIVWDRSTGEPIYNAIVWQDKRTSDYCQKIRESDAHAQLQYKTGLIADSYFSASKINWILDNVIDARTRAENGELAFGTVDTWLLWNLTKGESHATDYSNASRTLLFNIHTGDWDDELLSLFDIPRSILPEVKSSSAHFGDFVLGNASIPINGILGDQQAALFGQLGHSVGDMKNTYGTGCFLLLNTGDKPVTSQHGLLTTIAWHMNGKTTYALEGSVFVAGAAIQWLRDELNIIENAKETETLVLEAKGDNVVVVPAFSGLGAPYWDMQARGAILGLTRDSGKAEIVKATLESLALQTKDVVEAMAADSGIAIGRLKVDGGAIVNPYLAQYQADILNADIERPSNIETTALGAAYAAGIGVGVWSIESLMSKREIDQVYQSAMENDQRERITKRWKKAIQRVSAWLDEE